MAFILVSSVHASYPNCNEEDNKALCYSTTQVQYCNDWDGTGSKWGYCSEAQMDACFSEADVDACMSQCIGKSQDLIIGSDMVSWSPKPPDSCMVKNKCCANNIAYKVGCANGAIYANIDNCKWGCDGNVCADDPNPPVCSNGQQKPCTAPNKCEGMETCRDGQWDFCATKLQKCEDGSCQVTCPTPPPQICVAGQTKTCLTEDNQEGIATCLIDNTWGSCVVAIPPPSPPPKPFWPILLEVIGVGLLGVGIYFFYTRGRR